MCAVQTPEGHPLPLDEITTELRRLARALAVRFTDVATVAHECGEDSGVVEGADVDPAAQGAVSVWWMHSADDIIVGLADAPGWELPRTAASVEIVRAIMDAAAAGLVEVGKGRGITTYRVRTPDGEVREDTHEGLASVLLSMPWKPRLRWENAAPFAPSAAGHSDAVGRNARRRSETRQRRVGSSREAAPAAVTYRDGRKWMSVIGSMLVAAQSLLETSGERKQSWQTWSSFWTASPRTTPDAVHFEMFTAWIRFAYPLMVLVTVAFWLVDSQTSLELTPWVFFGLVAFALSSGVLHYARSAVSLRTVTRSAQVIAGWPQEVVLLALSLGAARVIGGA